MSPCKYTIVSPWHTCVSNLRYCIICFSATQSDVCISDVTLRGGRSRGGGEWEEEGDEEGVGSRRRGEG